MTLETWACVRRVSDGRWCTSGADDVAVDLKCVVIRVCWWRVDAFFSRDDALTR
jgi:hypothetical protein